MRTTPGHRTFEENLGLNPQSQRPLRSAPRLCHLCCKAHHPFVAVMDSNVVIPGNGHAAPLPTEEEKILISPGSPDATRCQEPQQCTKHGPRNLAIISIVCGFSCIGIVALIYAVKAEGAGDLQAARTMRRKSHRFSILSISLWVATLIFLPLFLGLLSYVIARAE